MAETETPQRGRAFATAMTFAAYAGIVLLLAGGVITALTLTRYPAGASLPAWAMGVSSGIDLILKLLAVLAILPAFREAAQGRWLSRRLAGSVRAFALLVVAVVLADMAMGVVRQLAFADTQFAGMAPFAALRAFNPGGLFLGLTLLFAAQALAVASARTGSAEPG